MDDGSFAGIVHQERNWTYVLVYGAGHRVSESNPAAVRYLFSITPTDANASLQAFILARGFIFGSNQTGLVKSASSVAIGGENANLTGASHDVVVAAPQIVVGTGATTATVTAPSATIAAWDSFLATRIPSSSGTSSSDSASSTAKSIEERGDVCESASAVVRDGSVGLAYPVVSRNSCAIFLYITRNRKCLCQT
jgi:carboxypeptidase D